MKLAQWTAVLVLAAMVGGITFVMVYLGGSRNPNIEKPPLDGLTFVFKRYPEEGAKALTTEVGKTGSQDFWFQNDTGRSVAVGLNAKSCKCTNIEVTIAPESWKPNLISEATARMLQRAPRTLPDWAVWVATFQHDRVFRPMPENEAKTTQLTSEESVEVPAGAVGWVRLSWRGERAEPRFLNADLWMNQHTGSINAVLEVGTIISEPMVVGKELVLDKLDLRDLEKDKLSHIVCYSITRPTFQVRAERSTENIKPESDPIEVGQPIPLATSTLRRLEESKERHMLRLLSGYKIPIILHARAKDGTPFETGHFRRFVKLTSPDEGIEPVEVEVTGFVEGDVKVGGPKEVGAILLGPFPSSRGAKGDITLQTDRPKLELTLDTTRVPSFVKARLEGPEKTPGDHRMWVLRVEVPPNAANGEFPRQEDPVFRDSAIYVKTNETPPRSIRIPVRGVANAG
jgi:hypothetical protein